MDVSELHYSTVLLKSLVLNIILLFINTVPDLVYYWRST